MPGKIKVFLFLAFISSAAHGFSVPSSFLNSRNGLYRQTLGAACFSFDINSDSAPCNPAYLAKERSSELKLQIFGGNNISYLAEATKISKGEAQAEDIQELFLKRSISEMQGAGSLLYIAEKYSLTYEPYAVRLHSTIRNSALPELTLIGTLDETIAGQFASYVVGDLYLGLGLRYMRRQSVAARFFATDVAAENGLEILNPQDKSFLFLEPGILYSPEDISWRPEFSMSLVNGGIHSTRETTSTDPIPEFHLGAAISPDLGLGRWGFSINSQWSSSDSDDGIEMLTLGSYYELGILTVFGSLSKHTQGLGFNTRFNHLNLGLSFLNRQEKIDLIETHQTRHILLLLGIEI